MFRTSLCFLTYGRTKTKLVSTFNFYVKFTSNSVVAYIFLYKKPVHIMWYHLLPWVCMSILGPSQSSKDFYTFSVDVNDVLPNNQLLYLPRKNSSDLSNSSSVSSTLTIEKKCSNPSMSTRAITFGNDLFISINDKIIGYCNDGINKTNANDLTNPSLVNCSDVLSCDLSNITQNNTSSNVISITVGLTTDTWSTSNYGATIWLKSVFAVLVTVSCDENDVPEPVQGATDKLSMGQKKLAEKAKTRKNNENKKIPNDINTHAINVMS